MASILNSCSRFVRHGLAGPCYLCAARTDAGLFCPGCAHDLLQATRTARCPRCAAATLAGEVCGRCLKKPPVVDRTCAAFDYQHPVDVLVQGLKYRGETLLAPYLAGALAQALRAHDPVNAVDLIVPMPLHPARLCERGFNQAALLAKGLSAGLGVAVDYEVARRTRNTEPQVEKSLRERRRNLRGAFACQARLTGLRVALVDDVMTSGTSLAELARAVRAAGAARVEAWVVARAQRQF